jgi:hypothetical protein
VSTDQGKDAACAIGRQVADAYAAAPGGFRTEPVTVTVAGQEWVCQRARITESPHRQCVGDGREMLRLTS